ncbi:MAG TPA: indole-3-glycerol-phosphate synthase [Polyangiaceae bacterium]|nr:indole-3-glycerol-phosphate synthase [Polyangiaceae bacterium]
METGGPTSAGDAVNWLASILSAKQREVDLLCQRSRVRSCREPIDVVGALRRPRSPDGALRMVCEIKLRSPSAGALSRALAPSERALAYAEAGASMVSVLCDGPFFDGSWDHLGSARRALDAAGRAVPLLAKEFVVHERQVHEARDRGGDAVLLIARIVDPGVLRRLADCARTEGIEPLVEVVDEPELEVALSAGARVIGVNARDLDTLAMNPRRTARLLGAIPVDRVAVHLSGLREPEDVAAIARGRADAALVGEALMRDDDPRPRLRAMVAAATPPFAWPDLRSHSTIGSGGSSRLD